jgi:hypothetical protein
VILVAYANNLIIMKNKYTAYTQWAGNLGGEVGFLELDL